MGTFSYTGRSGHFSPHGLALFDLIDDIQPRVRSAVDGAVLTPFTSPVEFMSWMWATAMTRATIMQDQGIPMFIARYEEFNERALEVLHRVVQLLRGPGQSGGPGCGRYHNSQEGTDQSRARELEPGSELTDERLAAFKLSLEKLAPSLGLDTVLLGTYGT